ncbi:hypothetical protein BGZ61DRAFT_516734 [Ilyonectria robusta]|uniref:uncharacterized protein n=1 Tax=Ilyonectria robusta TaxID=1079257 RepID=UPI001E8D8219|nr:uncharacterized protein BGZ61DRAFT_516734 [Ilyonectria robusta]KAH8714529.1 hypothetical protein BGZ61DRAFT_516734 [Ilyonectria robusta]
MCCPCEPEAVENPSSGPGATRQSYCDSSLFVPLRSTSEQHDHPGTPLAPRNTSGTQEHLWHPGTPLAPRNTSGTHRNGSPCQRQGLDCDDPSVDRIPRRTNTLTTRRVPKLADFFIVVTERPPFLRLRSGPGWLVEEYRALGNISAQVRISPRLQPSLNAKILTEDITSANWVNRRLAPVIAERAKSEFRDPETDNIYY